MNSDPGSESNDRPAIGPSDKDSRHAALLDFLIDQERKLLDAQDARQSSADAKIAASLTAALTLAAVTLTAAAAVGGADSNLGKWTYFAVVVVAVVALLARFVVGYQRAPSRTRVSTMSKKTNRAINKLREFECRLRAKQLDKGDAVQARYLALKVWRRKAEDSRHRAQHKEVAAAGAGLVLAVALSLSAILVFQIDWGDDEEQSGSPCSEIAKTDFLVAPGDPRDRDGDGIACES